MKLRSNNNHRDEHETADHTDKILRWAKERICAVSQSTPGKMMPLDRSILEPEPEQFASESKPKMVESPEVSTLNTATKLLVVELDETNARKGQVHLLADGPESSRFIEALLSRGLAPSRVVVLRGTPMNMNVTYRAAIAIDDLAHESPQTC